MLDQKMLKDSPNVTFSQELADGHTPSDWLDGTTKDLFGQAPALASLSPRQAQEMGLLTSGTYGHTGSTSSKSASLQSSLVSKLQASLQDSGSTLYRMTWKPWIMPSGRSLFRLRASALRTSETERTGWPTPAGRDCKGGYKGGRIRNGKWSTDTLDVTAQLAGWPTQQAIDAQGKARAPRLKKDSQRDPMAGGQLQSRHERCSVSAEQQSTLFGDAGANGHPTDGFWRDADWLFCRDGKWRPVKSGLEPLADGIPARMVRLRGYGNAINPQQAAVFIDAVSCYLQSVTNR